MVENSQKEIDLLSHYNSHPRYYSSIKEGFVDIVEKCLEHCEIKSIAGKTILDPGCGDGRLASIVEKLGASCYTGVDYSPVRTKIATDTKTSIPKKIITKTIQDFLKDNTETFDVIFLFETLEHLEQPDKVLHELKKIGTTIIGSVPIRLPYKAHLQVYKTEQEVEGKLGCKVIFTNQKHFFFIF